MLLCPPFRYVLVALLSCMSCMLLLSVAERLSDPKHLRGGVIFLDAIPRTTTGKTCRGQLKQMLLARQQREE